jgi:hypothetical protein
VQGRNWAGCCDIAINFHDADGVSTLEQIIPASRSFTTSFSIRAGAAVGLGSVEAHQYRGPPCRFVIEGQASAAFTVTGVAPSARKGDPNWR